MTQALAFCVLNGLAVMTAHSLAAWAFAGREPWRRALATLALFPVVILGTVLLLGATGRLHVPGATLVLIVAAAAAFLLARLGSSGGEPESTTERSKVASDDDPGARHVALALLAAFAAAMAARALFDGTFFVWDDLSYHAPVAAHWLTGQGFLLAPYNYHAYYPFNAETLSLWFMLPFRADAFVSLAGLVWAALAASAVASLTLAQGCSRAVAMLSAALALASPALRIQVQSFSAVDLAAAACALAAMVFAGASPPPRTPPARRLADPVLAGLMAGFAVGCKVSMAPVLIILVVAFALRRGVEVLTRRNRLASVGAFAVAAVATGSPWYLRNLFLTGNPFFPAHAGPFAGPFGRHEQWRTTIAGWITGGTGDVQQLIVTLKEHLNWPIGLAILAAAGFLGAIVVVARPGTGSRDARSLRLLLLSIGLLMIVLYPLTPFSGTDNSPLASIRTELRFMTLPFAIGLALFAPLLGSQRRRRAHLWLAFAIVAMMTGWNGDGTDAGVAGAGAAAVLALAARRGRDESRGIPRPERKMVATTAVALSVFLALAFLEPVKQRLTDDRIRSHGDPERPIEEVWSELERLPAGSRITWFGPGAYQYYPLFGRRFQHIPVPRKPDGSPWKPLHERWSEGSVTAWWERPSAADPNPAVLIENLCRGGPDFIVVTRWDSHAWPPQYQCLVEAPGIRTVFDDGYSAVFALK